jgi:hypothetical protein
MFDSLTLLHDAVAGHAAVRRPLVLRRPSGFGFVRDPVQPSDSGGAGTARWIAIVLTEFLQWMPPTRVFWHLMKAMSAGTWKRFLAWNSCSESSPHIFWSCLRGITAEQKRRLRESTAVTADNTADCAVRLPGK